jgi:hypothetical protein
MICHLHDIFCEVDPSNPARDGPAFGSALLFRRRGRCRANAAAADTSLEMEALLQHVDGPDCALHWFRASPIGLAAEN